MGWSPDPPLHLMFRGEPSDKLKTSVFKLVIQDFYRDLLNVTCDAWKFMFNCDIDKCVCIWTTMTDIYMILFSPGLMSSMSSTILPRNESMSDWNKKKCSV